MILAKDHGLTLEDICAKFFLDNTKIGQSFEDILVLISDIREQYAVLQDLMCIFFGKFGKLVFLFFYFFFFCFKLRHQVKCQAYLP